MTPLKGVDDQVYALGQGPIAVGGYVASGNAGGGVTKNHPTVGTISKGAIIEKEIPVPLEDKKELTLALFNSDFTTAEKVKRRHQPPLRRAERPWPSIPAPSGWPFRRNFNRIRLTGSRPSKGWR